MWQLDEHQKQILRFIERFENQNGHDPSYEEIRQGTGMSSKDHVHRDVQALEKQRYVQREPWISRGIRLLRTVEGYPVTPFAYSIPVIAPANCTHGDPSQTQVIRDWIEITRAMIPDAENVCAFRVQGDSMIDSLVHDGDLIVIKRQSSAREGELVAVVASIANNSPELSIKRISHKNGHILLQPENPQLGPVKCRLSDVSIEGLVLCVIRQMPQPDEVRADRRRAA